MCCFNGVGIKVIEEDFYSFIGWSFIKLDWKDKVWNGVWIEWVKLMGEFV